MPDVPIVNRAMVTAPKDYVLPQGQEILLKAVRAEIDGTGAGGSYLPALQLISDAGDVMWTAVQTGNTIAAGGTQSVSWFPGVSGGTSGVVIPGQILQQYFGHFTATDFTWTTANTEVSSGYPTNSTFTKISGTSKLLITANADFTAGTTMPNVFGMGLFIDGGLEENIFHDAADASTIKSVSWAKFTATTYTAGAHTLDMRVYFLNAGGTWTLRSSNAVDLSVIEIEI